MYEVSEWYEESITARSVRYEWYGVLTDSSGNTYSFSNSDIKEGGGKITREACSGESMEIGTAFASDLQLSLTLPDISRYSLYDGKIEIWFRLYQSPTSEIHEDIPCGIFYIDEATRTADVITVTAYDSMLKFETAFDATGTGTAYDHIATACTACGVTFGMTREQVEALPNGTKEVSLHPKANISTWRDMLGYVAMLLGCSAFIGRDDKLYMRHYKPYGSRSIHPSFRYSSEIADYNTIYTKVSLINMYTEEKETYKLSELVGEGLTYDLGANPFMQSTDAEEREQMAKNSLKKFGRLEFAPYQATTPCDPSLDLMDNLYFQGGYFPAGFTGSTITSMEIKIGGQMSLKGAGENPRLKDRKTKTQKEIASGGGGSSSGIHYYDYTNPRDIEIGDGEEKDIIDIEYSTDGKTHVCFHAQVILNIETTETVSGTEYSYPDGKITLKYVYDGVEFPTFKPPKIFTDGNNSFTLVNFFIAEAGITARFKVRLLAEGASVSIGAQQIRAWLEGSGLSDEEGGWDEDSHVKVIQVSALNVTENGTYTAPEGNAYSPVTVNVPAIELVDLSVTENGTYTPDTGKGYGTVNVNVPQEFSIKGSWDVTAKAGENLTTGETVYVTFSNIVLDHTPPYEVIEDYYPYGKFIKAGEVWAYGTENIGEIVYYDIATKSNIKSFSTEASPRIRFALRHGKYLMNRIRESYISDKNNFIIVWDSELETAYYVNPQKSVSYMAGSLPYYSTGTWTGAFVINDALLLRCVFKGKFAYGGESQTYLMTYNLNTHDCVFCTLPSECLFLSFDEGITWDASTIYEFDSDGRSFTAHSTGINDVSLCLGMYDYSLICERNNGTLAAYSYFNTSNVRESDLSPYADAILDADTGRVVWRNSGSTELCYADVTTMKLLGKCSIDSAWGINDFKGEHLVWHYSFYTFSALAYKAENRIHGTDLLGYVDKRYSEGDEVTVRALFA